MTSPSHPLAPRAHVMCMPIIACLFPISETRPTRFLHPAAPPVRGWAWGAVLIPDFRACRAESWESEGTGQSEKFGDRSVARCWHWAGVEWWLTGERRLTNPRRDTVLSSCLRPLWCDGGGGGGELLCFCPGPCESARATSRLGITSVTVRRDFLRSHETCRSAAAAAAAAPA